jgi:hypothetical protein
MQIRNLYNFEPAGQTAYCIGFLAMSTLVSSPLINFGKANSAGHKSKWQNHANTKMYTFLYMNYYCNQLFCSGVWLPRTKNVHPVFGPSGLNLLYEQMRMCSRGVMSRCWLWLMLIRCCRTSRWACAHDELWACAHTLMQDELMSGCSESLCAWTHELMQDEKLSRVRTNSITVLCKALKKFGRTLKKRLTKFDGAWEFSLGFGLSK